MTYCHAYPWLMYESWGGTDSCNPPGPRLAALPQASRSSCMPEDELGLGITSLEARYYLLTSTTFESILQDTGLVGQFSRALPERACGNLAVARRRSPMSCFQLSRTSGFGRFTYSRSWVSSSNYPASFAGARRPVTWPRALACVSACVG
jgi:hypothetical protein